MAMSNRIGLTEREAEELQRKVISYKKRFIALVESQVDEMDKFDERL